MRVVARLHCCRAQCFELEAVDLAADAFAVASDVTFAGRRLLLPMNSAVNSVSRRAVHALRRALLFDLAVVEQQDAVRDRHRFGLVVRDHQRRQAQAHDQFAQEGARFFAQLGVEVGQRLVEQDHRRVVDQRARNRDALLLAARQLVRKALARDGRGRAAASTFFTRSLISLPRSLRSFRP